MATVTGHDESRLKQLFSDFCALYPPPAGFGWSLRATRYNGSARRWYFLALIDWRGDLSSVKTGSGSYYLSEFCAFLEALIAAKQDPVLSGLATENGAKQ